MPTKFQFITELYDQTVRSVTSSYKSWTGFLRAACYNYKCPFDEQILIYKTAVRRHDHIPRSRRQQTRRKVSRAADPAGSFFNRTSPPIFLKF